jgi:hypothetical protein
MITPENGSLDVPKINTDLPKSNQLDNLYTSIITANTFATRAQRGENATVIDLGDGWVQKTDKSGGLPLVAREYAIMAYLDYDLKTGVTPRIDVDSGLEIVHL